MVEEKLNIAYHHPPPPTPVKFCKGETWPFFIHELIHVATFLSENCLDYLFRNKTTSGTYEIRPLKNESSFRVYCDQDTGTGGWINIGRRDGGALTFYDKSFKVCILLPVVCFHWHKYICTVCLYVFLT